MLAAWATVMAFLAASLATAALWFQQHPLIGLLLAFQVLDVATGLIAGWVTRELSSSVSFKGMSNKVLMLMLVAFGRLLEVGMAVLGAPETLPLESAVAGYYCVTEGLSILENAGRAGLPLPPVLKDVLVRLNPDAVKRSRLALPDDQS